MATQVTPPTQATPGSMFERIAALTSKANLSGGANGGTPPAPSEPNYGSPTPEPAQAPTPAAPTPSEPTPAAPPASSPTPSGPAVETVQTQQKEVPVPQQEPETPRNRYDEPDLVSDEVPQTTLDAIMQQPRGKEIVQGYRMLGDLAKPLNADGTGGIGHIPTVQQARDYYLAYRDQVLMHGDLNSGNPQQIDRFLTHVFDPGRGEAANMAIATQLVPALAANPALYATVMEPFLKHYHESLMERFKETRGYRENTDDEVADALWLAASIMNKDLNGEYLKPEEVAQPGTAARQAPDPFSAQRQAMAAERAELDRIKATNQQQHQAAWMNAYNQQVGTLLMQEIDAAMAPIKAMYANAPFMYESARQRVHDEIVAGVMADQHGMALHGVAMNNAFRTGTLQSAQEAANGYISRAQTLLKNNRRRFLEGAGLSAQRQVEQRHSEAAAVDAHRGVGNGSGGAPMPTRSAPITRDKDEPQADYVARMVRAATSKATRGMLRK